MLEEARVRLFRTYLTFAVLVVAAACSSVGRNPQKLGDIAITERGADAGGEFCKDFGMTPAQVSAFFDRAHLVDASELHGSFDHLPCYVRGTAVWEGQPATWEVRAGGTGMLTVKAGPPWLYGCSKCDDLLGQGKQ
jgi:hypothetical protein